MADLRIRLTPRAAREAVGPVRDDGVVLVRVTAAPVDGKANAAVCRLLAKRAGVAASAVSIVRGQTSRDKVVRFDGLVDADVRTRLGLN